MGERVLRELQWEAEGGTPERGDLLLVEGGTDRDQAVAAAVQLGPKASNDNVICLTSLGIKFRPGHCHSLTLDVFETSDINTLVR